MIYHDNRAMKIFKCGLLAVVLCVCAVAAAKQKSSRDTARDKPGNSIFVFHTDEFWLNLHHFLYVLGRDEAFAELIKRTGEAKP